MAASTTVEKKTNGGTAIEDPIFLRLNSNTSTVGSSSAPLHNYYSEYRLGHGDPLLKEAMKSWNCTTVEMDNETGNVTLPTETALVIPPCHILVDPTAGKLFWSTEDIIHPKSPTSEDRRFILLSDDKRYVLLQQQEKNEAQEEEETKKE